MVVLHSGILKFDLVIAIFLVVVVELSIGEINHMVIFSMNSKVMMHSYSLTMSFRFSSIEAFDALFVLGELDMIHFRLFLRLRFVDDRTTR